MPRTSALIYGVVCYLVFFGTFLYLCAFLGNFVVPKTIDSVASADAADAPLTAAMINLLLIAAFGLQHVVMARPAFKDVWTKYVPQPVERSTYVLLSSLLLVLLVWQWRPMPEVIWSVGPAIGRGVLWGVFGVGWLTVLVSTLLIDHFDLFGLRQVYLYWAGREYTSPPFKTMFLYNYIRHPLLLGWMIAFWATPDMTAGHLLYAVATTVYMLVSIPLEERDLLRFLGEPYRQYRERTPMLIPLPKGRES